MEQDIINDYKQRIAFAQQEADKYKTLANNYSLYRLLVFGLFIFSVCVAIGADEIFIIAFSFVVLIICFSLLIKKQNGFETLKNYYLDIKKVNENEIASMQSQANMYDSGSMFINDKHFYTSDLDIFGSNSLFQLINRAATAPGIVKLAGWFNTPGDKNEILLRQLAVNEIAGKNDWKLDIQANLLFSLKQQREQIKNLVNYLNIPVEIGGESWLGTYSRIAPYLLFAVIICSIFYIPERYFTPIVALSNLRLVSSRKEIINKTDLIAGRIGKTLSHFEFAFKSIENENWQSAYLKEVSSKN